MFGNLKTIFFKKKKEKYHLLQNTLPKNTFREKDHL